MRIAKNFRLWKLSDVLTICLLGISVVAFGQTKKLTTAEAKDHIGEQATVCGRVAGTRYAETTRGKPTFLNLDKQYPSQLFTVLIWGDHREKFGSPEEKYRDKQVCVTGKITEYRNAPEIVVSDPQNIEVQK
jgi:hypothetical protein